MLYAIVLVLLFASLRDATPHVSPKLLTTTQSTLRVRNTLKRATPSHTQLLRHLSFGLKQTQAASAADYLPTLVRPGLNGDACTAPDECEEPRLCVEFDADGTGIPCEGGDCSCLQPAADRMCTTDSDCDDGETCAAAISGDDLCFSSIVVGGASLDFEACTSTAECVSERACFGTTLTNGLLDCSTAASNCACVRVESNCDTFQDCLMGTACVRISSEIPASFCVANSFIVGNFPSGLTLSDCASDADCAGPRSCMLVGDEVVPCAGAEGCICFGGGPNVGCTSSRFCDFGETCNSDGEDGLCTAVADLV